jgi:hypothetical protein
MHSHRASWKVCLTMAVLAILINLRRQKIAADISKFGGSSAAIFFVTIN